MASATHSSGSSRLPRAVGEAFREQPRVEGDEEALAVDAVLLFLAGLDDKLGGPFATQVGGERRHTRAPCSFLVAFGRGVVADGQGEHPETGDAIEDGETAGGALGVPMQVGLAWEEQLAHLVTGVVLLGTDDHRGSDHVEQAGRTAPGGLVQVGDHGRRTDGRSVVLDVGRLRHSRVDGLDDPLLRADPRQRRSYLDAARQLVGKVHHHAHGFQV
jgi:hypothetical protein